MMERENINNNIADDLELRNRNWGQIEDELAEKADANRVYTKLEANTLLNEKANVNTVENGLTDRYTKAETDVLLNEKATVTDLTDGLDARYTKVETDGLLAGKADQSEVDKKADKQQEEWIAPTLNALVSNYGNGYSEIAYMKDSLGFVHIKGTVVAAENTVMFTLPVGYRPSEIVRFPAINNISPALVAITPSGNVQWRVGNTTLGMFGEIVFKAEA